MTTLFHASALQDRLDAFLVAAGTKVMNGFGTLHCRLYAVHKRSRRQLMQLVALLLLFPVFELHNLGFKVSYAAKNRRIVRLGGKELRLHLANDPVQFNHLGRYRRISLEREQTLRDVSCALQRSKCARDCIQHDGIPQADEIGRKDIGS